MTESKRDLTKVKPKFHYRLPISISIATLSFLLRETTNVNAMTLSTFPKGLAETDADTTVLSTVPTTSPTPKAAVSTPKLKTSNAPTSTQETNTNQSNTSNTETTTEIIDKTPNAETQETSITTKPSPDNNKAPSLTPTKDETSESPSTNTIPLPPESAPTLTNIPSASESFSSSISDISKIASPMMMSPPPAFMITNMVISHSMQAALMQQQAQSVASNQQLDAYNQFLTMWTIDVGGGLNIFGYPVGAPLPFPRPTFSPSHSKALTEDLLKTSLKKEKWTLWAQTMGSTDHQSARKDNSPSKSVGRGIIVGLDREMENNHMLGLSLSFNKTTVRPQINTFSETTVNTYLATITHGKGFQILNLSTSVFVGINRNKTKVQARDDLAYISKMEGASFNLSKNFLVDKIQLSPAYTLTGTLIQTNAYTENRTNYYKSQASRSLQSTLGIGSNYGFSAPSSDQHLFSLNGGITCNHTTKPKPVNIDTTTGLITVQPSSQPRLVWMYGVGYQFTHKEFALTLNYNAQLKSRFFGHAISMKLSRPF